MSVKELLVHLDASEQSAGRLRLACDLAARHDAHLIGLYAAQPLLPPPMFMESTFYVAAGELELMVQRWRREQEEERQEVASRFEKQVRNAGVSGQFRLAAGSIGGAVAAQARYADMTIIGQRNPDASARFGGLDIAPEVLFASGRPLLIVPYAMEPNRSIATNVLVGWSGTREATRAIHDAIPLLKSARLVTVLTVQARNGGAVETSDPAADMAHHLARHGIAVKAAHTVPDAISVGDVLLSYAADIGADLLVCGGYGHSRVREIMLGGVTELLLRSMTVPVLMSH